MNFEDESTELYRLFEFGKTDNGYELKRYLQKDNPDITELEIPSKFRYLTVRSIGTNAFKDAVYLRSVVIPETVASVGGNVFKGCRKLSDISLPEGLKTINVGMFSGCGSLKRVVVPESAKTIRTGAFTGCGALEEVVLPESCCVLYSGAFSECPSLRSVVFPGKGTVVLLGTAFENCPLLPAEARMYALIGSNDLDKPFVYNSGFDWDTALREDVFKLAVLHNSFAKIGSDVMFGQVIDRGLVGHLPIAKELLNTELAQTLADHAAEQGKTEITAWLLNYLNPPGELSIEQIINERFDL